MMEKAFSQRHACGLVGIDLSVYSCRSLRLDDVGLRQRLKELASRVEGLLPAGSHPAGA